jgi:DNA invertase Pin-like site-specific DNA recombinase
LVGFLSELHALKIDLFLRQQGLDTTTPAGKGLFQMMGVFAELERAMIAERVLAELARARGRVNGSVAPPIAPTLEKRIREALAAPGRPGVRVLPNGSELIPDSAADQPPFRRRKRRRRMTARGTK